MPYIHRMNVLLCNRQDKDLRMSSKGRLYTGYNLPRCGLAILYYGVVALATEKVAHLLEALINIPAKLEFHLKMNRMIH